MANAQKPEALEARTNWQSWLTAQARCGSPLEQPPGFRDQHSPRCAPVVLLVLVLLILQINRSCRPHSFSDSYSRARGPESALEPLIRQLLCSTLCSSWLGRLNLGASEPRATSVR